MCTRVFNNKNEKCLTTSRNMDWRTQLPTSIFSFQSGLTKFALDDEQAKTLSNWHWVSKYPSVVTMVGNKEYGFASSDGINSKGLVANVLYAKGTKYKLSEQKEYNNLSVLRWVQYVLDNFETAKKVKEAFEKNEIQLVDTKVPGSTSDASLHLSVSDEKGHSLIIEVYNGKYHIHYDKKYNVMTNEPNFNIQLKLNDYWLWQWSDKNEFPSHTIPGGPFPSDRFERASYYYRQLEEPKNAEESLAQSKSVVANASVPIGMTGFSDDHPNIAPTLWSTLSDHNNLKYYFCNARTPNVIWVDMKKDMSNNDVTKLDLVIQNGSSFINENYNGCINNDLKPTEDPYAAVTEIA